MLLRFGPASRIVVLDNFLLPLGAYLRIIDFASKDDTWAPLPSH